jgi:hypothetical protein
LLFIIVHLFSISKKNFLKKRKNIETNLADEFTHETLFSALISKSTKNESNLIDDIRLDIPDLPENVDYFRWQIPKTNNYEWIDYHQKMENNNLRTNAETNRMQKTNLNVSSGSEYDDEGFCSNKCSPNLTNVDTEINSNRNLWDLVLNFSISDYVNWDMRDEYGSYIYIN